MLLNVLCNCLDETPMVHASMKGFRKMSKLISRQAIQSEKCQTDENAAAPRTSAILGLVDSQLLASYHSLVTGRLQLLASHH